MPNLRPIFVDPDQVDVLRGVRVGAWTHTWGREQMKMKLKHVPVQRALCQNKEPLILEVFLN